MMWNVENRPLSMALKRIASEQEHLSSKAAGEVVAYLAQKGTKRFLLGHLSKRIIFPSYLPDGCNAL